MGIGAAHSKIQTGSRWKQNKDFEALLRRLNEGVEKEVGLVSEGDGEKGGEGIPEDAGEGIKKDKKRKRKDQHDAEEKTEKKKGGRKRKIWVTPQR